MQDSQGRPRRRRALMWGSLAGVLYTLVFFRRLGWEETVVWTIIASLVAFVVVLNAPLQLSNLEAAFTPKGTAFADIKLAGWASPRAWTIPFNIYGTLWLVGGALFSSVQLWRANRTRAWGTCS